MTKQTWSKVAVGVYKTRTGNYYVRKMINGTKICAPFTNKAKAIKYYKSLAK